MKKVEEKEDKKTVKKVTKKKLDDVKEIKKKKPTIKRIIRKKKTIEEPDTTIKSNDNEEVVEIQRGASFSLIEVIVIILITGIVVSVCSGLIVYNNYDKFITKTESQTSALNEFIESYNKIINNYVEKVDEKGLIDAAIKGMYSFLGDQYSIYMDEETTTSLREQLEGKYEGIGVEITMNEELFVVISKIFTDTPAEKAGLKPGDLIIAIDDESMIGKTSSDVANTIKKGDKSSFVITYRRDGKDEKTTIQKKTVYINSVTGEVKDGVGYIKLDTFSATTVSQIKSAIDKFDETVKSIIIDVRGNSGGYLTTAYDASDLFIEKGKTIYQLKNKNGKITKKDAKMDPYRKFDKIVVLIDEGSASASEILAVALKESADATIVGVKSYGKGTVQETEPLTSGSMVKYTTAYWLSPNGNSINEIGIKPDIEVVQNYETEEDDQLLKAIETAK